MAHGAGYEFYMAAFALNAIDEVLTPASQANNCGIDHEFPWQFAVNRFTCIVHDSALNAGSAAGRSGQIRLASGRTDEVEVVTIWN
jgi:hypothetical protein